jgi:hypothetical protein
MAKDIEIISISTLIANSTQTLPVSQGFTNYKSIAAASTWILSTAAILNTITVIPATTGATTLVLSDGSTAILSIPAAAHAVDAKPYTVDLGGIRNTAAAGFKIVTGASVAAVVSGTFGTPTTA